MNTDTYKDPEPYVAINLMTNEILSRHNFQYKGYEAHKGEPVEVYYRPRRRKTKAKEFPYL